MNRPLRNGFRYALSGLIGIGALSGVLYFVGWRQTIAQVHALGAIGIIAVLGNVALAMAAWIVCWWIILLTYGIHLPIRKIIGARLSGYAISYITPSLYFGGEPVRAFMVADRQLAPATRVFATVIVERFLGGLSMIAFILIGGFQAAISPAIPWPEKRLLIAGIGFITFWIIVGLLNFAWNLKWISRGIDRIGRIIPRWKGPLARGAAKVSETEDEVHLAFTKYLRGTLTALAVQTLATFFVYIRPQVFFHFSAGFTLSFPQLSLLFTLNILLSSFLWITPGGLGTGEAGMIGIFRLVAPSIPTGGVVAYSLMFKGAESLLVVIGIVYLAQRGLVYLRERGELARGEDAHPE